MKRALVVATVAGLCLIGAGPAGAVFPGENGRIAYLDETNVPQTGFYIHTVLPSGPGDTVIGLGHGPAWSPNGRRIAFIGVTGNTQNIETMRADGSDVRQLTLNGENTGDTTPSYGPGGGRIVFVDDPDPDGKITTIRWDGSKRRVIGRGRDVTWSPNGQIAYIKGPAGARRTSLWAMRPNGTHKHRLVWLGTFGGSLPIYSPDGSEFVFYRSHLDHSGLDAIGRTLLADANGDNIRRPPCRRAISYPRSIDHYGPTRAPLTFSPDGRSFLVWSENPTSGQGILIRVSLSSCTGQRIVNGAYPYADWQALPTP